MQLQSHQSPTPKSLARPRNWGWREFWLPFLNATSQSLRAFCRDHTAKAAYQATRCLQTPRFTARAHNMSPARDVVPAPAVSNAEDSGLRALLAALEPLPPYETFAQTRKRSHVAKTSGVKGANNGPDVRTSKRPRAEHAPTSTALPTSIQSQVDAVRRQGAPADTLFFQSVPPHLSEESALKSTIGVQVRDVKIVHSSKAQQRSSCLAWVSFFNEADCVTSLCRLRQTFPELKVRLHKPKAGSGTATLPVNVHERQASLREAFQNRAQKIISEGGLANTLMLRQLPAEVSDEELMICTTVGDEGCVPLRTRSTEPRGSDHANKRIAWITYASKEIACAAFVALSGATISFRCGKSLRLAPAVHNDATDAETKKRRAREMAIGRQPPDNGARANESPHSQWTGSYGPGRHEQATETARYVVPAGPLPRAPVDALDDILRRKFSKFYFIE